MNIRNVVTLFTLVLATVVSINTHAQDSRIYIDGRSAADANVPPYSGAVLIGDTLHLAGSIGRDENLEVPDDPADEARNVLNAIKRSVEAAGMTMEGTSPTLAPRLFSSRPSAVCCASDSLCCASSAPSRACIKDSCESWRTADGIDACPARSPTGWSATTRGYAHHPLHFRHAGVR